MPSELITERRDATLVLTISDPATRNTLSAQVIAAGIEALGAAESNDGIRAIILRGEGKTFCAGGNLNGLLERRAAGHEEQRRMLEHLHHFVETIRAYPKPVLASVEGTAAGAGFSLVLACDLVVAAVDARFVLSYAKVGLTPDGGATWGLVRALPRALVLKMIWLGEPVSAELMHAHGIVTTIAPSGLALEETLRIAERLAAMAPNAVSGAKELVDAAPGHTLNEQLGAERDRFIEMLFHDNGGEGLEAFFAKRAPRFS